MNRKFFALLLTLLMVLALVPASAYADTSKNSGKEIAVLFTNDVHCAVDKNLGYQSVALAKETLEAQGKDVLLVDVGDAVQGDAIGTLSKGEYIIKIMNELGYDVATIGNHEFDYGMDQFKKLNRLADFPYVSANFMDKNGETVLDAYSMQNVHGVKIAFVGVTTPKTITSSTPAYFQNEKGEWIFSFCQDETGELVYTAVQSAVDAARKEGADYVIALAHLGIEKDCEPWTSSDVINNTTGIDVMLDGHSHSVIEKELVKNKDGKDVILSSTGTKLENIGCLTISADGKLDVELLNDDGIGEYIADIQEEFDGLVNEVVAHTDVDLAVYDPKNPEERLIRVTETNLGDLCADAYRVMSGADVAIVNGGGIRSDIKAGDITYGDIIAVHPFGNSMCVVECTGQQILNALELGASALPGESGGFLQVSGMSYTIDLNVESTVKRDKDGLFLSVDGDRRVKDVKIGDKALDPEQTYTLACHDYLLKNGGDGYTMFKDCTLTQDCVMLDNQVLINYIVDKLGGSVGKDYSEPYGAGRITIVEAK